MASIADLFFKALLDDGQLQLDASKAGDKAGQTLGKKMTTSIAGSLKTTAFTALAIAGGIATRGLIELDQIQKQFQADTGATEEASIAAGKAINAMSGRNIQPMKEIAAALTRVHTDLGLVGDAAVAETEKFLKFARVTGRNAADEVSAFDDILSAWNLTADKSGLIMDALVVSHQRYGGVISDDEKALRDLAPALIAANETWQDGLALIDLFKASGADVETAIVGLTHALGKVKSPGELRKLIADVIATEDPMLRAAKAADLFGSKAGAKLANVLRPGIGGLDDYAISATDAAGATQAAADVLDSSLGARFQLGIKAAGAAIVGLGNDFGGLATVLATLGTAGGALGLDKLLGRAWRGAASSALVHGAVRFAADQAATLYLKALYAGDFVAGALKAAWARVAGTAVVAAVIERAGSLAATAYLKALIAGDVIGGAVTALWTTLGATSVGQAIIAGTESGTMFAKAFALAVAAAPIVVPLLLVPSIQKAAQDFWKTVIPDIKLPTFEEFQSGAWLAEGQKAGEAAGEKLGPPITMGLAKSLAAQAPPLVDHWMTEVAKSFKASTVVSSSIGNMGANWTKVAKAQANRAGAAVAQGIREKRTAVDQSWQDLMDAIKNVEKPTAQRARLLGELASKELAAALKDGRTEVRAQAQATKQDIIDQLSYLGARANNIGKSGMEALRKGMKSKDPDIRAASLAIYKAATSHLTPLVPAATTLGYNVGSHFAAGLGSKAVLKLVADAGRRISQTLAWYLRISSPAKLGPLSTLGGPEGWGERIGAFLSKGLGKTLPDFSALGVGLGMPSMSLAHAVPNMNAAPYTAGVSSSSVVNNSRGGHTFQISLAGGQSRDPFEVPRQLRRLAEWGSFDPDPLAAPKP